MGRGLGIVNHNPFCTKEIGTHRKIEASGKPLGIGLRRCPRALPMMPDVVFSKRGGHT
jgi:hypothetical protein